MMLMLTPRKNPSSQRSASSSEKQRPYGAASWTAVRTAGCRQEPQSLPKQNFVDSAVTSNHFQVHDPLPFPSYFAKLVQ